MTDLQNYYIIRGCQGFLGKEEPEAFRKESEDPGESGVPEIWLRGLENSQADGELDQTGENTKCGEEAQR